MLLFLTIIFADTDFFFSSQISLLSVFVLFFFKPGQGIMHMKLVQDVRLMGSVASTGH